MVKSPIEVRLDYILNSIAKGVTFVKCTKPLCGSCRTRSNWPVTAACLICGLLLPWWCKNTSKMILTSKRRRHYMTELR